MRAPRPGSVTQRSGSETRPWWVWVGVLAVAACLGWAPFIGRALSPDEGGFLIVGGQWSAGASVYGDFWVDRPPLLVAFFGVAEWLGGPWALRSMGILAVVAGVVLAGVVARIAAPTAGRVALVVPATAAVFLATPLFGGSVVNGEVLGVPFVLGGVVSALLSARSSGTVAPLAWAVAAGACGATAFLVKQSIVDVFVFVLVVALLRGRSGLRLLLGAAVGGLALTALVLCFATARGTHPVDLWEAVIAFRGEASAVIAESATGSTATRLARVLLAFLGSGALLVAVVLARVSWRRMPADNDDGHDERAATIDLAAPAYALVAWEAVAVVLGGSYWLHYLMGLVPGLVVLATAAAQRRPDPRSLRLAYGFAALSTVAVTAWIAVAPIERPEAPVVAYFEDHARPGDTGIVAFGAANILQSADLTSPYPYLWSLPVRVRDPELHLLAEVLAGPDAPTWLVMAGDALDTWGVDPAAAEPYVEARYSYVTHAGRFTIYRLKDPS